MSAWGMGGGCLWLWRVPMQLQGSGRWQLYGPMAVAEAQCRLSIAAWVQTLKRAPAKQLHALLSHPYHSRLMPFTSISIWALVLPTKAAQGMALKLFGSERLHIQSCSTSMPFTQSA